MIQRDWVKESQSLFHFSMKSFLFIRLMRIWVKIVLKGEGMFGVEGDICERGICGRTTPLLCFSLEP